MLAVVLWQVALIVAGSFGTILGARWLYEVWQNRRWRRPRWWWWK